LINQNWTRWIFASLTKHFDSKKQTVAFYIEGDEQVYSEKKDYFEFRINGPDVWEQSKNTFKIEVTVNILVVHKLGQGNLHTLQRSIGIAQAAFEKNISIMKFGNGVDDNPLIRFGCMTLNNDRESLTVAQLGQVNPEVKELQAMVQGTYCMYHEG
jgi:hypothetical protein